MLVGGGETSGFRAEEARRFEEAVNSRDPGRLAEVLALGDQDPAEVAVAALPEGAELRVDESTFEASEGEAGTVQAEIVGDEAYRVTLFVVLEDGDWLVVSSTEPVPG